MNEEALSCLVIGATGPLGERVTRRLADCCDRVIGTWRTKRPDVLARLEDIGVETVDLDVKNHTKVAELMAEVDAVIFTPILSASGPAARTAMARGVDRRMVLFSSNNVAIDRKSRVYHDLWLEEQSLTTAGGNWVLFRPTMIYGYPGDDNLSKLVETARSLHVLPMPGSGTAMQQPIHIDDLADLAVDAVLRPDLFDGRQIWSAAGPDKVTLRELYDLVAKVVGGTKVVPMPVSPLHSVAKAADKAKLPFPVKPAQLSRIERNKTPAAPVPEGWPARIGLEEGLGRLLRELGT